MVYIDYSYMHHMLKLPFHYDQTMIYNLTSKYSVNNLSYMAQEILTQTNMQLYFFSIYILA